MKFFGVLVLTCICTLLKAQFYNDHEIDESKISPWTVTTPKIYSGTYNFGMSEWESKVEIVWSSTQIICTVSSSEEELYGPDGSFSGWKTKIDTYTNVSISGNQFQSDQSIGEFVLYDDGNNLVRCLKLNTPPNPTQDGKYELGDKYEKAKNHQGFGEYPITAVEIISPKRLAKMPLWDLKIMRNEIFARHGYIFQKGGKMDIYFSKQTWYNGSLTDVSYLLNDIETQNLKIILAVEKSKTY